jgi:spermidine synthase
VPGHDSGFAAGPDRSPGATRAPHDWGFLLAAPGPAPPPLRLGAWRPDTLTQARLAEAARAADRTRIDGLRASTLVHPRY